MSKINKVKLLLERTSRAPLVIFMIAVVLVVAMSMTVTNVVFFVMVAEVVIIMSDD